MSSIVGHPSGKHLHVLNLNYTMWFPNVTVHVFILSKSDSSAKSWLVVSSTSQGYWEAQMW